MDQQISIEQLKNVIAFKDLPDDQLEWILAHSGYVEFEDSALIYKTGDSIDTMAILLEGKLDYYMNVKGKLVFYFSFENNDVTGGVTGLLPYSRLREVHGDIYAVGKIRMLKLHKRYFPELEKINPDLIQRLIGYMTERARIFANIQMQQEKVSALGKLAAGIAHELNNPASAIDRISDELSIRLKRNVELTGVLLNNNISPELIHKISGITHSKKTRRYTRERISPLERLRMEEDLNDWLDDNGFDNPGEISETFIDAGISPGDLDKIKGDTGDKAFQSIIHWLENLISSELIILDLEDASERITNLVGAIKSHVHMDRSGALHYTEDRKSVV